jgi:uncharacterized OsmC-like protein
MKKEATVHIFKDKDHNIVACQLDDSKNIIHGFSLNDNQLTPLHMLNIALGQCLTELALLFLGRRNLQETCLTMIRINIKNGGTHRLECADIAVRLPLQLSAEDEVILARVLRQCPIYATLSESFPIRIIICEDRELISQYEQNVLTDIQHTKEITPFSCTLDYPVNLQY